jgi:hypothetical protein
MPSEDVEVNSVNTKWKVNANRDKSFIVSAALRMLRHYRIAFDWGAIC